MRYNGGDMKVKYLFLILTLVLAAPTIYADPNMDDPGMAEKADGTSELPHILAMQNCSAGTYCPVNHRAPNIRLTDSAAPAGALINKEQAETKR